MCSISTWHKVTRYHLIDITPCIGHITEVIVMVKDAVYTSWSRFCILNHDNWETNINHLINEEGPIFKTTTLEASVTTKGQNPQLATGMCSHVLNIITCVPNHNCWHLYLVNIYYSSPLE